MTRNSLLKAAISSALLIGSSANSMADYVEAGDWSKVRLYGHNNNLISQYTRSELDYIKAHFSLNTIEKAHNKAIYEGQSTLALKQAASRIKNWNAKFPTTNTKSLYYWNAEIAYDNSYKEIADMLTNTPWWFKDTPNGVPRPFSFEFPNVTSQWKWADVPNNAVSSSDLYGTFIDAVGLAQRRGTFSRTMDAIRKLRGFTIYNGFFVLKTDYGVSVNAGNRVLDITDGVFVEFMASGSFCTTKEQAAKQIELLLEVPADKTIVCIGWPESLVRKTGPADHRFSMVAYLICANANSYYGYMDKGWHKVFVDANKDSIPDASNGLNHMDFKRRLGKPLGPGNRISEYVYDRRFENAYVFINLETGNSTINWNP